MGKIYVTSYGSMNGYLPVTGGAMSGDIDMGNSQIINCDRIQLDKTHGLRLGDTDFGYGTLPDYTDSLGSRKNGEFIKMVAGTPVLDSHVANKYYVDRHIKSESVELMPANGTGHVSIRNDKPALFQTTYSCPGTFLCARGANLFRDSKHVHCINYLNDGILQDLVFSTLPDGQYYETSGGITLTVFYY